MKKLRIALVAIASMSFFVSSCKKDKTPEPDGAGNYDPIVLDCDYFSEDRVLTVNPDSDVDYVITCWMDVGGHIKVEPGVVIEFEEEAGINVEESSNAQISFAAVGTSSNPIIFRGKENQKGYWTDVYYYDASSLDNELRHVVIQDAGYERWYATRAGGVIINGNDDTHLKMSNTTFKNNKN